MRAPILRHHSKSTNTWLGRIRENVGHLLLPGRRLCASSANGAPIHLLTFEKTSRSRRAQAISFATHAVLLAAVMMALTHPPGKPPNSTSVKIPGVLHYPTEFLRGFAAKPAEGSGSGGDNSPVPATHGNLPFPSAIQLVKPSLRHSPDSQLPVPPTMLDSNAPSVLIRIDQLGLPWMREDTNSPGPGDGHTIGSIPGETMGDGGRGQAGDGETGNYWRGGTLPSCAYCPLPPYTDEARQVKMQGTVTLRVLVGTDGRATEIRVVRGIGYGLEERAVQAVRSWRFSPARDSNRRAAAAWAIIEVVFRLF
jgi:periplasmic protein TonB